PFFVGALNVPSQHPPSLRVSWTRTGVPSGNGGGRRLAPFPAKLIFAFPAAPDLSAAFVRPSGIAALSAYLKPPWRDFQPGFAPHVPPAAPARRRSALPSYRQSV